MPFFKGKPFKFKLSKNSKHPEAESSQITEDPDEYRSSDDRLSDMRIDEDVAAMNARIRILEEEKNMILVKNEILLHMLAEAIQSLKNAENHKNNYDDESN